MTAALVLISCYFAGPYIDQYVGLKNVEYWTFQKLAQLSGGPLEPRTVNLVLIGDNEYWLGKPAGRLPTNRRYIADILTSLANSGASVLALDFDLRSPDPAKPLIQSEYREETDDLISEIVRLASNHKIVLAKTIWTNAQSGLYSLDQDIYQAYGICTVLDQTGKWKNPGTSTYQISSAAAENISCGYVALPYDMRLVPGQIDVDGKHLDSFALAISRSIAPTAARDAIGMNFGSYMGPGAWTDAGALSDGAGLAHLLQGRPDAFRKKIVIIGAGWSSLALGRGDPVDWHVTPAGMLNGPMIHGNLVESILEHRTFRATASWLPEACELAFSVFAALIFSLEHSPVTKLLALIAVSCSFLIVQWLLLLTAGVFFEALIPTFGLWLHSMVERLIGESE
jgi:hypothetical protein